MVTYLIVNLFFTAIILLILHSKRALQLGRAVSITLLVLLITTAIFDSLIIHFGVVDYDEGLITGLRIGKAPVEDFFYAIIAVLLVPSVWELLGKDKKRAKQ